jgi:HEAT repeats
LFLLLLACGALLALASVWGYEREPRYKGRTLRDWVRAFEMSMDDGAMPAGSVKGREAMEAVRHMKQWALPRAVRLASYEKPGWKTAVERFMEFRLNIRRWAPRWVWARFYEEPAEDAVVYFRMLGAEGRAAIPDLEAMAADPKRGSSGLWAVESLSEIGPEAVPALARIVANTQAKPRLAAILKLNALGTNAAPAAPLLVACMRDPDWRIAGNAAEVLAKLRFQPEATVAALTNLLSRPYAVLRMVTLTSLEQFGNEARSAVPALQKALRDPNPLVRLHATNALRRLAPQALP